MPSKKLFGFAVFTSALLSSAAATAQIKQPGAHAHYGVDLEPHLVVMWERGPAQHYQYDDDGFGLGLRATIPFFHNGPIPKINNNMGIGFGLDYIHFGYDTDEYCALYGGQWCNGVRDYTANVFWFPVVMQWNFFVHPRIAVFGEVGLALSVTSYHLSVPCNPNPGMLCSANDTDVDPFEPIFSAGGRFMLSDAIGLTVRLGFPQVTFGASFLL